MTFQEDFMKERMGSDARIDVGVDVDVDDATMQR